MGTARWWALGLGAIAVAVLSVATRPRDPPVRPKVDRRAPVPPLPRPIPARGERAPRVVTDAFTALAPGVEGVDLAEGGGVDVFPGHVITTELTVWAVDGRVVESSFDHDAPVRWAVGREAYPLGLDAAVAGMRVGGWRVVWLEPDAAYGGYGLPGRVPAGTGVWLEIEILEVRIPWERMPDTVGTLRPGDGPAWRAGDAATLDYAVWASSAPEKPLDQSLLRWFPHHLRAGEPVPAAFAAALDGLRPGGRRVVRIPAADAFDPEGRPPLLPPADDVVVWVELSSTGG